MKRQYAAGSVGSSALRFWPEPPIPMRNDLAADVMIAKSAAELICE
jgi:hypothetical protein